MELTLSACYPKRISNVFNYQAYTMYFEHDDFIDEYVITGTTIIFKDPLPVVDCIEVRYEP